MFLFFECICMDSFDGLELIFEIKYKDLYYQCGSQVSIIDSVIRNVTSSW
jgi:hypothetical protein